MRHFHNLQDAQARVSRAKRYRSVASSLRDVQGGLMTLTLLCTAGIVFLPCHAIPTYTRIWEVAVLCGIWTLAIRNYERVVGLRHRLLVTADHLTSRLPPINRRRH